MDNNNKIPCLFYSICLVLLHYLSAIHFKFYFHLLVACPNHISGLLPQNFGLVVGTYESFLNVHGVVVLFVGGWDT